MTTSPSVLRVAVVQSDLVACSPEANLKHFTSIVEAYRDAVDLFVLPESLSTGFASGATERAEAMDGYSLTQLRELSARYGVGICGTLFIREDDKVYNRFVLLDGVEPIQMQDKRHLFSMAGEASSVTPAATRRILHFRGWRILPVICYDLRFPVWCRCRGNDYDMIVSVANWPEARVEVWSTLLKARAMENLAWVVGCNRIGTDSDGLVHSGASAIINPRGTVVASCPAHTAAVAIAEVDYDSMARLRSKFPVWKDADSFDLHL